MSIAMLVDQGLLDWNAPMIDYMPYFGLIDPYATRIASAKDLLSHITGLPGHDWANFDKKMSRADITKELRHLDMSYPIRTKHQYNNWLFMVAGHLVECVTGKTYEEFVQERILSPLGMEKTTFSDRKARQNDNFSVYHFWNSKEEVEKFDFGPRSDEDEGKFHVRNPAGGLISNADELTKWLQFLLSDGTWNGEKLISKEVRDELFKPHFVDDWAEDLDYLGDPTASLGWFNQPYKGRKVVLHGGYFGSRVVVLPKDGLGIAVLSTLRGVGTRLFMLMYMHIIDRILGLGDTEYEKDSVELARREKEDARRDREENKKKRPMNTQPSHPIDDYAGTFISPAHTKIVFVYENDELKIKDWHGAKLRHYHYDTFEVAHDDDAGMKIIFTTDVDGKISGFNIPTVVLKNPISFKKKED